MTSRHACSLAILMMVTSTTASSAQSLSVYIKCNMCTGRTIGASRTGGKGTGDASLPRCADLCLQTAGCEFISFFDGWCNRYSKCTPRQQLTPDDVYDTPDPRYTAYRVEASAATTTAPKAPVLFKVTGTMGNTRSMARAYDVEAVQHSNDTNQWIFAVHDAEYTKMVGVTIVDGMEAGSRTARYVSYKAPLNADSITSAWDSGSDYIYVDSIEVHGYNLASITVVSGPSVYNYCGLPSNWWTSTAPWVDGGEEQCFPNLRATREAVCTEGDINSDECTQAKNATRNAMEEKSALGDATRSLKKAKDAACRGKKKSTNENECHEATMLWEAADNKWVALKKAAKCPTTELVGEGWCQNKDGKDDYDGNTVRGSRDECIDMLEKAPTAVGMYYYKPDSKCRVLYDKNELGNIKNSNEDENYECYKRRYWATQRNVPSGSRRLRRLRGNVDL